MATLVFGQLLSQFALDRFDLVIEVFEMRPQTLDNSNQARRQRYFMLGQYGRQTFDDGRPFGQADPEFQQEGVDLVDRGCPVTHQHLTHTMRGRDGLLAFISRANEAHVRPARRFADRLRIGKVILVALDERFYELR